jgi:hypothetical protein
MNEAYNHISDIWSVGVILLDLLCYSKKYISMRNNFYEDSRSDEICHDKKFVFKWFSYMIGPPSDISFIPLEWIYDKKRLTKYIQFEENHPIVDLLFKLLTWSKHDRIDTSNALLHPCFVNLNKNLINKVDLEQTFRWSNTTLCKQTEITQDMRKTLFDWLWEVYIEFKTVVNIRMLVIVYYFIDKYTSKKNITKVNYQLLACAVLFVICKIYCKGYFPDFDFFKMITCNLFTEDDLIKMETHVMFTFDFNILNISQYIYKQKLNKFQWILLCGLISIGKIKKKKITNMLIDIDLELLKHIELIPTKLQVEVRKHIKYIQ